FIENRGPIQCALRLRIAAREIDVLGDGSTRSRAEDPNYVVAQPEWMTRSTRTPTKVRHAPGDGRLSRCGRVEFADGGMIQLFADLDLIGVRSRRRQTFGSESRRNFFHRSSQIDHGDIARDVVHHISSLVSPADHDASWILSSR